MRRGRHIHRWFSFGWLGKERWQCVECGTWLKQSKGNPMRGKLLVMIALLLVIALPAQAHNFAGSGDCDGWTLNLDGLYGATVITVDGNPVPLQLTHEIPDGSAATSRSFVVFWDKPANDVTVTHTLYRQGECTPEVTTTTAQVTTTTAEVTTTTQPETTTTTPNQTTTTTQPTVETTTTTIGEQCPPGTVHQPPLCVTTTIPHFDPTTTVPPITTEETLPFTGADTAAMAGLGASLAALGALILLGTRSRKVEG